MKVLLYLQLLDTLPVCQDFNRQGCTRPTCRFVHIREGEHQFQFAIHSLVTPIIARQSSQVILIFVELVTNQLTEMCQTFQIIDRTVPSPFSLYICMFTTFCCFIHSVVLLSITVEDYP